MQSVRARSSETGRGETTLRSSRRRIRLDTSLPRKDRFSRRVAPIAAAGVWYKRPRRLVARELVPSRKQGPFLVPRLRGGRDAGNSSRHGYDGIKMEVIRSKPLWVSGSGWKLQTKRRPERMRGHGFRLFPSLPRARATEVTRLVIGGNWGTADQN